MSYVIVITKTSPFSETEAYQEMVSCGAKSDIADKYTALNQKRGCDVLKIETAHFDDGERAGKA